MIRPFRSSDLEGAVAANDAVGWSGRRALFDYYSTRHDCALFVAEVNGEIAGTGGATIFPGPPATGWVHDIVVRPGQQRSGLGGRLTEAAIAWLRARSAAAVLLLATDAGRLPASYVLDYAATGEDRRSFIEAFASSGWVATAGADVLGFHVACPWGGGPIVARDADAGLALLRRAAAVRRMPRSLGLPEANRVAVEYLNKLGITADRYVTRMWLGAPPPWRADMIFGVFNFGVA